MKFSSVIVTLAASCYAQNNSPAPSNTVSSVMPSASAMTAMEACAKQKGCNLSDMNCQATCAGVPNPSSSQINATTNCVAACNKTNIQEYTLCSQNCINNNYISINIPGFKNSSSNNNTSNMSSSALVQSSFLTTTSSLIVGMSLFASFLLA